MLITVQTDWGFIAVIDGTKYNDYSNNVQDTNGFNLRQFKHVITYHETLQSIAGDYLDDVNDWYRLVEYNHLVYPYIVDTPQEKLTDVSHLMCPGDTIIVPVNTKLSTLDPTKLPKNDQDAIENLALGTDLSITGTLNNFQNEGTHQGILEVTGNGKGDLQLVSGHENVMQALILRLFTAKGTLKLHTDYGSDLDKMIGMPTSIYLQATDNTISQTLQTDERITYVKKLSSSILGSYYTGTWEVQPQGIETSFQFVLKGDETGNFTLQ